MHRDTTALSAKRRNPPRHSATGAAIRWIRRMRCEALREVELDIEEGADIIMVKPAGPYLDIIRMIRDRYTQPLAAYQVSGEFSALMAAGRLGWLDLPRTMMESLMGFAVPAPI